MALTQEQKKQFKSIGHHLKPVLIVAENGLTEGVLAELERALNDHELIKVKLALAERDDRRALLDELCAQSRSDLVQSIGKMALVYRKNPKPNKNLLEHQPFRRHLMSHPTKVGKLPDLVQTYSSSRPGTGCNTSSRPHIATAR